MSKNTPEDNKTIENQLINIKNQLNTLKANTLVNPDSIKVVIRSSASNMYYDGEFKDNPGLAAARANTAETLVLNSDIAIPADNIMKESSVNGPVYPPTQADLDKFLPGKGIITANYQQHLDEIEAAIYRPYQYVQVALQYQEKQPEPRFTVQKESDFKNEVEGMNTR